MLYNGFTVGIETKDMITHIGPQHFTYTTKWVISLGPIRIIL